MPAIPARVKTRASNVVPKRKVSPPALAVASVGLASVACAPKYRVTQTAAPAAPARLYESDVHDAPVPHAAASILPIVARLPPTKSSNPRGGAARKYLRAVSLDCPSHSAGAGPCDRCTDTTAPWMSTTNVVMRRMTN